MSFVWDFDWYERDLAATIKAAFPQARAMKRTGAHILGLPVVVDPTMPANRVDLLDEKGKVLGRIENLSAVTTENP